MTMPHFVIYALDKLNREAARIQSGWCGSKAWLTR
jgi:hypothetical protein